jgi:hypothetical protein
MNKIEQRFLTLIASNTNRSFAAAHRILDSISTSVLYSSANELISRARYLNIADTPEKAESANQLANQILGVLKQRNEEVTDLNAKLLENINMM